MGKRVGGGRDGLGTGEWVERLTSWSLSPAYRGEGDGEWGIWDGCQEDRAGFQAVGIPSSFLAQVGRKMGTIDFNSMQMQMLGGSGRWQSRSQRLHLHALAPGLPLMECAAHLGQLMQEPLPPPPPLPLLLGLAGLMEVVGHAHDLPASAAEAMFSLGTGKHAEHGPNRRLGLGTLPAHFMF